MIKPITPDEAFKHIPDIPDFVFSIVNELICKNMKQNGTSTFTQNAVVKAILAGGHASSSSILYDNNMLDFEPAYRSVGWRVKYDKPAYCETYDPYFKFSKPKAKK